MPHAATPRRMPRRSPTAAVPAERPAGRLPRIALSALVLALTLLVTGLGMQSASAAGSPPGKAWIRAAHLVPGIGSVQIDLTPASGGAGSSIAMSGSASYGDVTGYQKVAPGSYTVNVRDTGAAKASSPMLSRAFTVTAGQALTLAVLGTSAAPRLATLTDDLTPPAAGTASVRVLPAASAAPQVSITAANGPVITSNAVLGQASSYAAVPAGTWHLQLSGGNGKTATQDVTVASGSVYTLVVLDGSAGSVRIKGVVDAAGAMAAPKGGAATGGGAMAAQLDGSPASAAAGMPWAPAALVSLLALLSVVGLASARRSRPEPAHIRRS